jgi:peroxiredoxin
MLIATDDVQKHYGGIRNTPILFLLDKSGKVVDVFDRFKKSNLIRMENRIRGLLALEPLALPGPIPKMNLAVLKAKKAPDFSLPTIDGQTITLSKLANKVVLLLFWSGADAVSIGALVSLEMKFYQKYGQDVEVIGVNIGLEEEVKAKSTNTVKDNQIKIPVVHATPALIKQYGNIDSTPAILVIDRGGYIREIYKKFDYKIAEQIENNILSLLKSTTSSPEAIPLKDLIGRSAKDLPWSTTLISKSLRREIYHYAPSQLVSMR